MSPLHTLVCSGTQKVCYKNTPYLRVININIYIYIYTIYTSCSEAAKMIKKVRWPACRVLQSTWPRILASSRTRAIRPARILKIWTACTLNFHMGKKPIQPISMGYSFFTCGRITTQRQPKGLCETIRIVHGLHSNSFSNLAAYVAAPPPNFPAKAAESSRFVSVGCYPDEFV